MKRNFYSVGQDISLVSMSMETSEIYRELRNREDNRKFFFSDKIISKEDQEKWFCAYLNNNTQYMFAIKEKESGLFVGGIGIYDINAEERSCEVGRIILDRELVKGKGYGAIAIKLATQIAKEQLNISHFYAFIYEDNIASIRSFFKAGFTKDEAYKENGVVKVSMTIEGGTE